MEYGLLIYVTAMKKSLAFITTAATFLAATTQSFAQSAAPLIRQNNNFVNANTRVENIPTLIVNIISAVAIVLAVVYLMFGGIKLITAKGDRAAVESARKHIFSAVIGLVVVFGVFVLIQFIFNILGAENPLSKGFTLPSINHDDSSPSP